jgi:hypothetical protein
VLSALWENGRHPIHRVDSAIAGMGGQHQMDYLNATYIGEPETTTFAHDWRQQVDSDF